MRWPVRNAMQRACVRCGVALMAHTPTPESSHGCRVPDDVWKAIVTYAAENGRTWRANLRALWTSGRDVAELRQARNILGPTGLDKCRPERSKDWEEAARA